MTTKPGDRDSEGNIIREGDVVLERVGDEFVSRIVGRDVHGIAAAEKKFHDSLKEESEVEQEGG